LTDPDPNLLKSAAAYLLEVARSTTGRRNRKGAKIDALRQCKDEIIEAYRSGLNIHRIAQIFRERNVDISTQHLMRAIRLFIAEGEVAQGKASMRAGDSGGSGCFFGLLALRAESRIPAPESVLPLLVEHSGSYLQEHMRPTRTHPMFFLLVPLKSQDALSGENWVGCHLITHLALHHHFRQNRRPVSNCT
jgi:hypothetical protein